MTDKNTQRQIQAADDAIGSAVTACMSKIEQMIGRWEAVGSTYIVEGALLALCDGMTKLIDDPVLADMAGKFFVQFRCHVDLLCPLLSFVPCWFSSTRPSMGAPRLSAGTGEVFCWFQTD